MRRRSLNIRKLFGGLIIVFGIIVFFTTALLPLERFILDFASSFLWRYNDLTRQQTSDFFPPDGIRVIGRRSDEFQTTFLVNKPLTEGTKIISGNILIGIVRSQSNTASKVESLSSPFLKTEGIFERSGVATKLEGKGAGLMEASVPRGVAVERGDAVWYDEGHILLLGRVAKVVDSQSNPFLTILIEHPINFSTLWIVEALE